MNQSNNILVVLPNPMGDAIMCIPALRRLRQSLPHTRITYMANPVVRAILDGVPWTDDWLDYNKSRVALCHMPLLADLRRHKFDTAVVMPNSFRSALTVRLAGVKKRIGYDRDGRGILLTCPIPVPRLLERRAPISMGDYYGFLTDKAIELVLGATVPSNAKADNRLQLFTNENDRREIDELLHHWSLTNEKRMVIMVPGGAFGPSKCWLPERFAQLADKLTEPRYRVIISCAPNDAERQIAEQITTLAERPVYNLSDKGISLGGLKELIRRCCLMIANDTGPCHIAAAFNVPMVTIFGPTDPRWTVTGYDKEIRLRVDVDCPPCQKPTCSRDHRCMTEITVDDVYAAAKKQLSPSSAAAAQQNINNLVGTYYSPFTESFTTLSSGIGLIHKDYLPLLEQQNLASLHDVFAYQHGQKLTKPGLGARQRLRLELLLNKNKKVVVYLKRYDYPGPIRLLRQWLSRRSLAAEAVYDFIAAISLAENNIPVARPIAYGTQSHRRRSFVMFEELPNADALQRLLPQWSQKKTEYDLLRNKKKLLSQTAQLVRRLHNCGFCHRDLYLAHIFLGRDRTACERLSLIDLHRVFTPAILRRRWQVKDLAQLYYSARTYFTAADVMRFLLEYFQSDRLTTRQKRFIHAVYRKTQRIAGHDQNRIRKQQKAQ